MPSLIDMILRRTPEESNIPVCPAHHLEMDLRGKLGRPSRCAATEEEDYTLIYFCPREDCNESATRSVRRTQIPVPGRAPKRPDFARTGDR